MIMKYIHLLLYTQELQINLLKIIEVQFSHGSQSLFDYEHVGFQSFLIIAVSKIDESGIAYFSF